jgi:lysophospholipid acyltransferase (LPLAT)-like uncharacterized protein
VRIAAAPGDLRALRELDRPVLFVLWHNRLFMAAELHRRYRPGRRLYGLISASRDGAWLTAFFLACGVETVRGSSSRLGREAVKGLVDVMRAGDDAGITPDGPRGPAYEMKPGALVVARRSHAAVVLVGLDFESSRRFPSWDGFHLPLPFSRVHARFQFVDPDVAQYRDEGAAKLGAALAALNPDRTPAPVRRSG